MASLGEIGCLRTCTTSLYEKKSSCSFIGPRPGRIGPWTGWRATGPRVRLYLQLAEVSRWRAGVAGGGAQATPQQDERQEDEDENGIASGTRLSKLLRAATELLKNRWSDIRPRFFLKVFVLLAGFFSANALSTIVGQTGDWDVLVAGFLVAVVESLGWVVYRVPTQSTIPLVIWLRGVIIMLNYYKAGLIYGLFVDCFKVGS